MRLLVMVSSMITQDIERKTAGAKTNKQMISFLPLHVYSHQRKNPSLNSKEKFTYEQQILIQAILINSSFTRTLLVESSQYTYCKFNFVQ